MATIDIESFDAQHMTGVFSFKDPVTVPTGTWELSDKVLLVVIVASVLGSVYILVTYWFFRSEANVRRRFLACAATCCFVSSITNMCGFLFPFEGVACAVSGVVLLSTELASVLYMCCVAAHTHRLHQAIAHLGHKGRSPSEAGRGEPHYHILVWLVTAIAVATLALFEDPFPQKREAFELSCAISAENTLARMIHYALPVALGLHFYAVYYYLLNENIWHEASKMHLTSEMRGSGYALLTSDVMGSSSQKLSKYFLRVSVTIRHIFLVLVLCHGPAVAETMFRTLVKNEIVQWLYLVRILGSPIKAIMLACVFESRGKFIEKYRNRLHKRARRHHQKLREKMAIYDAGHRVVRESGKLAVKSSKLAQKHSEKLAVRSDKFISGQLVTGASIAKKSAGVTFKGASKFRSGRKSSEDEQSPQLDAESDTDSDIDDQVAMLTDAVKLLNPRGPVARTVSRIVRLTLKIFCSIILFPVAITAWVPLYFVDNFVRGWRRRRGYPEIRSIYSYLFSLVYFIMLVAPVLLFSHIVSDRIADNDRISYGVISYSYLAIPYLFVMYGFWINRFDPEMATIPDPRPNNRVKGNYFEGLLGYSILGYEFVAFTSMSFLSDQVVSRMDGSLTQREEMSDAMATMLAANLTWNMETWLMQQRDTEDNIVDEGNTRLLFLDFFHNNSYQIQFVSTYALVVLWVLMWVLPIVVKIMWSPTISQELVAMPLGPVSWSLVQFFLSDLAFLAIARGLLAAIDCSENPLLGYVQLDAMSKADPVPECWTGNHLVYANLALLGLYIFLPTATLGKITEYTPGQDMRWIPLWVRVDLFARSFLLLLVLHTDAKRSTAIVCNSVAVCVHAIVLWCVVVMRPCCVFWANWAKIVIHSCAVWSTSVALAIIVFDIRSVPPVLLLNIAGWIGIFAVVKFKQNSFVLIDSVMRHDRKSAGYLPQRERLACKARIQELERLLTANKAIMSISQWCHHSLVLELLCFCEIRQLEVKNTAFEAFTRISVSPAADAFMDRCPTESVVHLLMKNVTPDSHAFRKLFTAIRVLSSEMGTADFKSAMNVLLKVVDDHMRGIAPDEPKIAQKFGGWPSAQACLQACGFDLTGDLHENTTIADVHKLKAVITVARDRCGYDGVRTSVLNDKLKEMEKSFNMSHNASKRKSRASAAKALVNFSRPKHFRHLLIDAGIVEVMCELLDEDSSNLQVDAMKCLMHLTEDDSNHLVQIARDVLPNIRLWFHRTLSSDIVALHAAVTLVARISRRFDLVYYLEKERMLSIVTQTCCLLLNSEMLKVKSCHVGSVDPEAVRNERETVENNYDDGDDDNGSVTYVYFHQLPTAIKGMIDSRFITDLSDVKKLGFRSNVPAMSRKMDRQINKWKTNQSSQLCIPSTMLEPLLQESITNMLSTMAEVSFYWDLRESVVQSGILQCWDRCLNDDSVINKLTLLTVLQGCKNLIMPPFGLKVIAHNRELQAFYVSLLQYKRSSLGYEQFDRSSKIFKRNLIFDGLSSAQRQNVHLVADFLKLDHRSVGTGAGRRVEITDPIARRQQVFSVGVYHVTVRAGRNFDQLAAKHLNSLVCKLAHGNDVFQTQVASSDNSSVTWNPEETFKIRSITGKGSVILSLHGSQNSESLGQLSLDIGTAQSSPLAVEKWYSLIDTEDTSSADSLAPEILLKTQFFPDSDSSVFVELDVIEARGLPVDIVKPNPFCTVVLNDQEANTRVVDDSISPYWAETFVFATKNVQETTMTITVFSSWSLGSPEVLGMVDIRLSGYTSEKRYEQWHKLDRPANAMAPTGLSREWTHLEFDEDEQFHTHVSTAALHLGITLKDRKGTGNLRTESRELRDKNTLSRASSTNSVQPIKIEPISGSGHEHRLELAGSPLLSNSSVELIPNETDVNLNESNFAASIPATNKKTALKEAAAHDHATDDQIVDKYHTALDTVSSQRQTRIKQASIVTVTKSHDYLSKNKELWHDGAEHRTANEVASSDRVSSRVTPPKRNHDAWNQVYNQFMGSEQGGVASMPRHSTSSYTFRSPLSRVPSPEDSNLGSRDTASGMTGLKPGASLLRHGNIYEFESRTQFHQSDASVSNRLRMQWRPMPRRADTQLTPLALADRTRGGSGENKERALPEICTPKGSRYDPWDETLVDTDWTSLWSPRLGRDLQLVGPAAQCMADPVFAKQCIQSMRQSFIDGRLLDHVVRLSTGDDLEVTSLCIDILNTVLEDHDMVAQLGAKLEELLTVLNQVLHGESFVLAVLASRGLIAGLVGQNFYYRSRERNGKRSPQERWVAAIRTISLVSMFTKVRRKIKKKRGSKRHSGAATMRII